MIMMICGPCGGGGAVSAQRAPVKLIARSKDKETRNFHRA
jgi:hypothetical protein